MTNSKMGFFRRMGLTMKMSGLSLLEILRHPSYVLTTLLFPSMFFWFFGVPNATEPGAAQHLMGSFSAFAVLGVVLFQLSVGVAQDRASSWDVYLRTLPVPSSVFLMARLISSFVLALLAVAGVVLTAYFTTTVDLPTARWAPFFVAVIIGGIPFAGMGLVLGLISTPKSAVPLANMVYLPLSFAGGLWIPPNGLSKTIQKISEHLPTRFYGEIVWSSVLGKNLQEQFVWGHIIYSVAFILMAMVLHRRDEGARFG